VVWRAKRICESCRGVRGGGRRSSRLVRSGVWCLWCGEGRNLRIEVLGDERKGESEDKRRFLE